MKTLAILCFALSTLAFGQNHASATITQVVTAPLLNASVTASSSLNPAPTGTTLTVTANVAGSAAQPTGQVIFSYNGVQIIETGLVNGVATCTLPGAQITTPGSYPITATYIPDAAAAKIYN